MVEFGDLEIHTIINIFSGLIRQSKWGLSG